ncbi:MAG: YbaK/EbsC family protein [Pseudomonadota bacterium]
MSKSLKRVKAALAALGHADDVIEVANARTAKEAAEALGCEVGQIANSILLLGARSGRVKLFLTSGAQRVDLDLASLCAGEPLIKADAGTIRAQSGFAIGGVAPIGHLTKIACWTDRSLLDYDIVFAAAGTPQHLFGISPADLMRISSSQPADFIE